MNAPTQKDFLGSAWIIVAALLFTVMSLLVKTTAQQFHMHSHELVFWRVIVGFVLLGTQAVLAKRSFRTPHIKGHIGRSLAGTGGLLLFFYGISHLPLGTAVTLNYTSAIFLALLSMLLYKERPPFNIWLALIIGLAGIATLLQPTFDKGQEWAALIGLASGLCAGFAYLQVRELGKLGEPAWRIVFYFSLISSIISALFATLEGWHMPTLQSLPYLLGIGVSSMLAQLALTQAYRVGRKFTVASLSYLTVVFAALGGVVFFGDSLSLLETAGIVLIIASGIISSLR